MAGCDGYASAHSGVDVTVRDGEGPGNSHAAGEVRNRAGAASGGTNEPGKVDRSSLTRVHGQQHGTAPSMVAETL
jgi:hypothetical protein